MLEPVLIEIIKSNKYTDERLFLQYLEDSDIPNLVDALTYNTHIKVLQLYGESLTPACTKELAKIKVETLHIADFMILDEGFINFAENQFIKNLSICGGGITGNGFSVFVQRNKIVEELNLQDNHVDDAGLSALEFNTNLRLLSLHSQHPPLKPSAAKIIADKSKNLTILDLSCNEIGNEGAKYLANSISLTSLLISTNKVTEPGVLAFINNENLESLVLLGNVYDIKCANYFTKNPKLKTEVERDGRENHFDFEAFFNESKGDLSILKQYENQFKRKRKEDEDDQDYHQKNSPGLTKEVVNSK